MPETNSSSVQPQVQGRKTRQAVAVLTAAIALLLIAALWHTFSQRPPLVVLRDPIAEPPSLIERIKAKILVNWQKLRNRFAGKSNAAAGPGSSPQILIASEFAEYQAGTPVDAWLGPPIAETKTGLRAWLLSPAEFGTFKGVLTQTSGVDLLSAPKVLTLHGGQAQVQVTSVRAIKVVPGLTTNMSFGPTIIVVPYALPDGSINLNAVATIREFRGYDAVSVPPAPIIRERMAFATAKIKSGATLIIGGAIPEKTTVGGVRKSNTNEVGTLFMFTPSIVTPAGTTPTRQKSGGK